jgi:hypothetical protein
MVRVLACCSCVYQGAPAAGGEGGLARNGQLLLLLLLLVGGVASSGWSVAAACDLRHLPARMSTGRAVDWQR